MNDIIWDCETYPNIFTINAQHAWLPIEWSFETWAINPGLKEWFKDYRDQVTAAKQRRRDELHQGPKTERTRVPGYTGPREPAAEKRVA